MERARSYRKVKFGACGGDAHSRDFRLFGYPAPRV